MASEHAEKAVWYGFGGCTYTLETPEIFNESDLVVMADDFARQDLSSFSQGVEAAESTTDKIKWTWPEMQKFTGRDRKTISSRAERLDIKFLERPATRGTIENGLRESDLRRIMNNR